MLRNPAYRGMACFGKTQESARQRRSSRTVRLQEKPPRRGARTQHETPREQWIQIPVPALVDERTFDLAQQHKDRVMRELLQVDRRVERLLTAYQEELLSLDELRRRMPELRQRELRLKAELASLDDQLGDQATYLRLAHTLGDFLERLRT